MQKLTRERGKYIRITTDAKEYIRGAEVRAVRWNGREIRNGKIPWTTSSALLSAHISLCLSQP